MENEIQNIKRGLEVFSNMINGNNPKPKGRPRKANKLIKMSITLSPAQMEWLEKTATEKGIERSDLLRDCVDKCIKSEV